MPPSALVVTRDGAAALARFRRGVQTLPLFKTGRVSGNPPVVPVCEPALIQVHLYFLLARLFQRNAMRLKNRRYYVVESREFARNLSSAFAERAAVAIPSGDRATAERLFPLRAELLQPCDDLVFRIGRIGVADLRPQALPPFDIRLQFIVEFAFRT